MYKKRIIITLVCLSLSLNCFAQEYVDSLQLKLSEFYNQNNLPGFALAIVNMDSVLFESSFGYANLEKRKFYTLETVQSVASVSKTTIAFAIMKLYEEGKLSLNSPINDFLPYDVSNPFFKDSLIRIKHLVTHTSGIIDTENNYDLRRRYFIKQTNLKESKLDSENLSYLKLFKKNNKISIKKYCENVFSKNGKWYEKKTFNEYPPGGYYQYSNLGAVLMAHIVERVSDQRFDVFVKEILFNELEMEVSNFELDQSNSPLLSASYVTENFISTPRFGDNTYPDGGLMTNCKELSLYLIEMIKGYNGNSELLKSSSYKLMMSPMLTEKVVFSEDTGKKIKNIGVFWHLTKDGKIMHNGGNPLGGTVYMSFNPKTNIGRILVTNCDVRASREIIIQYISIWRTMEKYSEKL